MKLGDELPWDEIEKIYNARLNNERKGAGYTYIDHFNWNAYNEHKDLKTHIEAYLRMFGVLQTSDYHMLFRKKRDEVPKRSSSHPVFLA